VQLNVTAGLPGAYAVVVNGTNFTGATWNTYSTSNLTVNLGTTDGVYVVNVGLRGYPTNATQTWNNYSFTVDRVAPVLVITNPVAVGGTNTVSQPYLQLQGYANEQLASLSYDISNAAGIATNLHAFVTDQGFDTNVFDFTTNYFQAYDVALATNVNRITLRATDNAGNTTTTNFNVTLDYTMATNPPVIQLFWPQNGEQISGSNFTWRGWVDDPTATVSASITSTNGDTNTVTGLVERNGNFWVEDLPLATGTNNLTLTVTSAANHTSTTNIIVLPNPVTVTMTPVEDSQLWQATVSASGTISDSSYALWINGVKATVDDGDWSADNVPMSAGGVAVFDITLYAPGETEPDGSTGN
jgi:hypothetical protein